MRIIREKTAAVCVDYQERILPAMTDPETLLQNTVKLLEGLRVLGVPVYLTQQYTKGLGDTVAPIREAAGATEHLEKLTFSAYPQLREKLLPPEQQPYVLLCGIESHICVLQTAMDLKAHGYQPYLVADCLSSRKPADHRMALERAKQEGILLRRHPRQQGHPEDHQVKSVGRPPASHAFAYPTGISTMPMPRRRAYSMVRRVPPGSPSCTAISSEA